MVETRSIAGGFPDPVRDAQAIFRAVMVAMSEPCVARPMLGAICPPGPAPLFPATTAIALALLDFETSVFLDGGFGTHSDAAAYLRFHTGASLAEEPRQADFAIISDIARAPRLSAFKQGEPEYPDRSTTIIVQVESIRGEGETFSGPGLAGPTPLRTEPSVPDFNGQWRANTSLYPCGVDIIFVTRQSIAGLPRSVSLMEG